MLHRVHTAQIGDTRMPHAWPTGTFQEKAIRQQACFFWREKYLLSQVPWRQTSKIYNCIAFHCLCHALRKCSGRRHNAFYTTKDQGYGKFKGCIRHQSSPDNRMPTSITDSHKQPGDRQASVCCVMSTHDMHHFHHVVSSSVPQKQVEWCMMYSCQPMQGLW